MKIWSNLVERSEEYKKMRTRKFIAYSSLVNKYIHSYKIKVLEPPCPWRLLIEWLIFYLFSDFII